MACVALILVERAHQSCHRWQRQVYTDVFAKMAATVDQVQAINEVLAATISNDRQGQEEDRSVFDPTFDEE